jgi:hypothetical protein
MVRRTFRSLNRGDERGNCVEWDIHWGLYPVRGVRSIERDARPAWLGSPRRVGLPRASCLFGNGSDPSVATTSGPHRGSRMSPESAGPFDGQHGDDRSVAKPEV